MKFELFGKPRKIRPSYGLTPLGKIKSEELGIGGNKGAVMSALEELGTATLNELSEKTGMPPKRVKLALDSLKLSGYIHVITSNED